MWKINNFAHLVPSQCKEHGRDESLVFMMFISGELTISTISLKSVHTYEQHTNEEKYHVTINIPL